MNERVKGLVPSYISCIKPYSPGKPIEELERELGIEGSIKLASNENPLGPSPRAVDAMKEAATGVHRYPDGGCYYLKNKLSQFYGVEPENIIFGNGSNEIIELIVRTFVRNGDRVVTAEPTFLIYRMVVQAAGGHTVTIPLKNFTYDLKALAGAIDQYTRVVFISNPNNPTGTIIKRDEFEWFLGEIPEDVIVVMDEAYYEFVTDQEFPDGLDYIDSIKPVITLRTFSKVYGLAGLRIGYGIAHPYIIENLNRVRQPFNINSIAQAAAIAALDDREHLCKTIDNNLKGLEFLFKELERLGLETVPTQTNFFLIKVGNGNEVYKRLLQKGVIVRPMDGYGLGEYIRVTVGLPEENERFIYALREVIDR